MNSLKTVLILTVTLTAINGAADQLRAGKFGIKISVGGHGFHGKPRCSDPHRCPPRPRPLPRPEPIYRGYHLGVWTSLVELVSPAEQPAAAFAPATHVESAHAQPNYALQIDRIVPHSAATRAGLKPGDVLLTANGRTLRCKKDLLTAIRHSHGRLILQVLDVRTGRVETVKAYPTPE